MLAHRVKNLGCIFTVGFHHSGPERYNEPADTLYADDHRHLALRNRIVVAPTCQYSAVDGNMTD